MLCSRLSSSGCYPGENGVNELLEFIKVLGFPAAVAFFVLWRLDKRLEELTKVLAELCSKIKITPK